MKFLQPDMAIWLLLLPPAVFAWWLQVRAKRGFRRRAGFGPVLRALSRFSPGRRDGLVLAAVVIAVTALVLAMMRPQIMVDSRSPEYEHRDLVLILDRSASMRARDIPPSRLGRAITEIKAFLRNKPEEIDRIGLVGFAGTAVTLSYLTRDVDAMFFFLDWVRQDPNVYFGTDIAAALDAGRELVHKDDKPTRKIFLLVSDGDDQGPELAGVLDELRSEGTPVHSIGIGSGRGVPIPVASRNGVLQYLQDESGNAVTTHFDPATLRRVAALTGGHFFRSTTGHDLADDMVTVVRQARRQIGWRHTAGYRDMHSPLLMIAGAATFFLLMKA